jgi:hypothetical protein
MIEEMKKSRKGREETSTSKPKGGTTFKSAAMLISRGKNVIPLLDYIDY